MSFKSIVKKTAEIREVNSPETLYKQECDQLKKELLETYGKRVDKILSMMKTIEENDPKIWKSEEMYPFFTDAMYHKFGYFNYSKDALGNRADGFCGEYDFKITGSNVDFDDTYDDNKYFSRSMFSINKAKDMKNVFDEYEKNFFEFIKKTYGENALD